MSEVGGGEFEGDGQPSGESDTYPDSTTKDVLALGGGSSADAPAILVRIAERPVMLPSERKPRGEAVQIAWPELAGCPDVETHTSTGDFFVLIGGTSKDWQVPFQRYGARWFEKLSEAKRCRAFALSLFSDRSDIDRLKNIPKFANHQVMTFRMQADWGQLNCDHDSHHSWWPSSAFVPPPNEITAA